MPRRSGMRRGIAAVLVSLQDWGTRYVMGDGSLTPTSAATSLEARRVHGLGGTRVPPVLLTRTDGVDVDPFDDERWTILYCFPGAFAPGARGYPTGWGEIPGAGGCTLESMTYRDRAAAFTACRSGGARRQHATTGPPGGLRCVRRTAVPAGERPGQPAQRSAAAADLPRVGTASAQAPHDARRPAAPGQAVQFPVQDPAGSVDEALQMLIDLTDVDRRTRLTPPPGLRSGTTESADGVGRSRGGRG